MKDRDHAVASVATLRAELAELRPRLAQAERDRDDARSLNELLDAAHRKVTAERDEALAAMESLCAAVRDECGDPDDDPDCDLASYLRTAEAVVAARRAAGLDHCDLLDGLPTEP